MVKYLTETIFLMLLLVLMFKNNIIQGIFDTWPIHFSNRMKDAEIEMMKIRGSLPKLP